MCDDGVDLQATFHYIDKVYAARNEAARALNRAVLVTLIVSLFLVLAATGLVKPPPEISIFGAKLKPSFAILLVSGMTLVACLMVYIRALILRMWAMYVELPRLYDKINFGRDGRENRAMRDSLTSPFRSLSYGQLLKASLVSELYPARRSVERWYEILTFRFVSFAIVAFPPLAELAAILKLGDLFGWRDLWFLVGVLWFLVCFAVTCITAYPPEGRFKANG